ncbi:MAG: PAS domain S-box protein [Candidatus Fermentibacteraceae bacterium]|nr:PAS domain S-box protein [Candidatus Fermentibacteraceae bacterium]
MHSESAGDPNTPVSVPTSNLSNSVGLTVFLFSPEGTVVSVQGNTKSFYPDNPESLSGISLEDIFPPDVSAAFKGALKNNATGETVEFSYTLKKDTGNTHFTASCSPVYRNGAFDGSLAVTEQGNVSENQYEVLFKKEELYRTLVDMTSMGIVIVSDGKLVFANPGTTDVSGYSHDELIGRDFITLISPAERKRVGQIHSSRFAGETTPEVYETQILRNDGTILDIEITARKFEYRGKPSTQVIAKNISLNKQAERELLSIQETLQEKVAERTAELEKYREHLQEVVDEKTTRLRNTVSLLRIEIKERIVAEERAEHLKQMLKAIRSINLLITKETDIQVLIDNVCSRLVEARDYKDVWILLNNKDSSYMMASATQNGEDLEPLKTEFVQGSHPPCIVKSLSTEKSWSSDPAGSICSECLLRPASSESRHIMSCRLEYSGKVFGVLTVAGLGPVMPDKEELGLFEEVCDDIAFALDSIEREKEKDLAHKALNESEDRYKALFENSGMAILFMREDMILDCNAKAAEVFRCRRKDLIGMRPYDLSPRIQPDGRLSAEKGADKIQAAITKEPQHFTWTHTRIDGENFPTEISLNAVNIGGKNYIQALVNDITSRTKAEEALRLSENNFRTLSNNVPVGIFRSNPSENGTLLALNTAMVSMFGYESENELLQGSAENLFISQKSRTSFLNRLNSTGVVENYETPMRKKDGTEFWASISARFLTQDDNHQANIIDGIISDISEIKLQQETLRKTLESFKKTIEGTVSAMSLLVEMKDPYTSGHQKGVALLACAIGREMGLDDDTIDCLRIASTLHDLGKLNVPLEILNKPGPLNEFEMDFLKTHPGAGYDILKAVEFPWPIAEVIHQHHERQDGSGYPRGLKGDEIMIEASIIAVADVVEAVASRRPYRASMGVEAALDIILDGRGTFFREDVVDSCLRLFREKGFTLIDHDKRVVQTQFEF